MTAKTFEPPLAVLGGSAQASVCLPEHFTRWIVGAKPRERIRYAVARWLPKEASAPVLAVIRAAHDDGELEFVQQRLADGTFAYFAVRRERRRKPAPAARFVARGPGGVRA